MAIVGRRQDVALVCKHCRLSFLHICEEWVNMVLNAEVLSLDAGDGYVYLRCPTCKQYEESGHQCQRGRVLLKDPDDPDMCKQLVLVGGTKVLFCNRAKGHMAPHADVNGLSWL